MNLAVRGIRGMPLFEADSSVDLDDRQQTLNCYSGIAFETPSLLGPGDRFALMNARARSIHFMPMLVPDGTIDESDRLHLIDLYGRFGADPPAGSIVASPYYYLKHVAGRN